MLPRLTVVVCMLVAALTAAEYRGLVKSNGLPLPGASVTAVQGDHKLVTTTDENGRYAFENLAAGTWVLEVELFGFEKTRREVQITPEAATLDFDLKLMKAAAPAPAAPQPPKLRNGAAGFETLNVTQTVERELLQAQTEAAPNPDLSQNANEAFLVSGSLSRGLEVSQQELEGPFGMMRPGFGPGFGGPPGMGGPGEGQGLPGSMPGMEGPGGPGGPGGSGGPGGGPGMRGGPPGGFGGGGGPGGFGGRGGGPGGGFGGRGGPGGPGMRGSSGGPTRKGWQGRSGTMLFGNRSNRQRDAIRGGASFSLRNSALDAKPYSLTGQSIPKPSYAQNRFGLTAGGTLRIPHVIKDDKTFFFATYFGTRARNPFDQVATLPSPLERGGDFSQSIARGPIVVYDPKTREPFPGNRIPADRFSSAAGGLLSFIPLPNLPGQVQNYQIINSRPQNSDMFSVRGGRSIGRHDRLSIGYNLRNTNGQTSQLYGFRDSTSGRGQSLDLTWTHSFRPGLINNLRWNFSRNRNDTLPFFAYGPNVAADLGITGTSTDPLSYGPPNLSFTNFGGLTDASPSLRHDQTSSLSEGIITVRGKHTFRTGFEFRRTQSNLFTNANGRGTFTFTGLNTSALDERGQPLAGTGFDFADYLLGLPQSSSIRFGNPDIYFRGANYNWYAQEDWRLRSNLSLNLGLRYEYQTPLHEKYLRMANLDIAPGFTGVAVVTPGATGPYTGVFPQGLVDPDRNNFGPRGGFAWKPIPKKSLQIRGGYGIYFNSSVYTQEASRLAQQPPFAQTATINTSLARQLTLQNGFATAPTTQVTNSYAVDRDYKPGYAQTWNFAVQQDLKFAIVVEAGYLGTKGTGLDIQRLPNRATPGSPLTAEQRRQIGNATGFTFDSSEGNSIYHALQLRLSRRFRRGISANVLYTFAKSIDNASTFGGGGAVVAQNDKDLRAERGLSSFDQRHTFNASYVITSPVGEGASRIQVHGFSGRLLKDWTLTGGITARSGSPFTAQVSGNRADTGGTGLVGSGRADATGLPVTAGPGFFNLLAFAIPPAGRYGNSARNVIPGPGSFSFNASFGRTFRIAERRSVDIRMESNNILNTVNISRIGTTVNASNYGLATAAGGMRSMTANLRLRF